MKVSSKGIGLRPASSAERRTNRERATGFYVRNRPLPSSPHNSHGSLR